MHDPIFLAGKSEVATKEEAIVVKCDYRLENYKYFTENSGINLTVASFREV